MPSEDEYDDQQITKSPSEPAPTSQLETETEVDFNVIDKNSIPADHQPVHILNNQSFQ